VGKIVIKLDKYLHPKHSNQNPESARNAGSHAVMIGPFQLSSLPKRLASWDFAGACKRRMRILLQQQ